MLHFCCGVVCSHKRACRFQSVSVHLHFTFSDMLSDSRVCGCVLISTSFWSACACLLTFFVQFDLDVRGVAGQDTALTFPQFESNGEL